MGPVAGRIADRAPFGPMDHLTHDALVAAQLEYPTSRKPNFAIT
ncbi:MAG: hypothetical protein ABWZ99_08135 [Ilumatobacteraceae bacterium]